MNINLLVCVVFLFCGVLDLASAELRSAVLGGISGKSHIDDMIMAIDDSLLVCGGISGEADIPAGITPIKPINGKIGTESGFIANFAKDLSKINWFLVFPENTIVPSRMIQDKNGDIYIGGKIGDNFYNIPEFISKDTKNPQNIKAGLMKISAEGKRIFWGRLGGPNQSEITGMTIDKQGRLIWTGSPSGQGQASYVLRCDSNGNGVDWRDCGGKSSWAIYLAKKDAQLEANGQYFEFYNKAEKEGFDYDGPNNKWGKVYWWNFCFRLGGQVLCLPDGDIVVSSSLFFKFKIEGQKSNPAFNLFLARYSQEGRLKWSTNLYQEGDSVHTPDQKPRALTYDSNTDSIYLVATQHGSNIYRLKGDLRGDTGNMKISWVGKINAKDGKLLSGWYFMNNRNAPSPKGGGYELDGIPKGAPYPKLAGNELNKILVGDDGNVYIVGATGARMWTSPDAFQSWPNDLDGGQYPCLIVLDNNLSKYLYASVFMGGYNTKGNGGAFNGLVLDKNRIIAAGKINGAGFVKGSKLPFSATDGEGNTKAALIEITDLKVK